MISLSLAQPMHFSIPFAPHFQLRGRWVGVQLLCWARLTHHRHLPFHYYQYTAKYSHFFFKHSLLLHLDLITLLYSTAWMTNTVTISELSRHCRSYCVPLLLVTSWQAYHQWGTLQTLSRKLSCGNHQMLSLHLQLNPRAVLREHTSALFLQETFAP